MSIPLLQSRAGTGASVRRHPRGSQVLRVCHGDSLALVIDTNAAIGPHPNSIGVAISEMADQSTRKNLPVDTVVYRPNAYYWSKFFHNNGTNFVIDRRTNVASDEGDNYWQRMMDRSGWNLGGPFTEADLGTTASAMSLMYQLDCAFEARGLMHVDDRGNRLRTNYITFGASSSRNAPFGNPVATWDADPTINSLTPRFKDFWFDPALAKLRTDMAAQARAEWEQDPDWAKYAGDARCVNGGVPEDPVIILDLVLFTAGGADGLLLPDAQALGANLQRVLNCQRRNFRGAAPTVLVRPYYTGNAAFAYWSEAQASFDAQFDSFATPQVDYIRLDSDISMQEERLSSGASIPGIHPDANGMGPMAQRIVDAYERMASRGAQAVAL